MPRAVVTGGAGFLGAHLCRNLLDRGWDVVAVDDLSTGTEDHVADLVESRDGFSLVCHDVVDSIPVDGPLDAVLHFASAASPREYLSRPLATLAVGSTGTQHALELASATRARFLLASTSEVYGDPEVHPQPESYRGSVSPVGVRSVYDEAKRFAEALTMAYHRVFGVDAKIARIFNTYGPLLEPADGRVISNFLAQAAAGEPLAVYGDGTQTRSFCYVDDEIAGLLALLDSDWIGPMNLGNPVEHTILEVAKLVLDVTGSSSEVTFESLPPDDPARRCPDISLAERELGWQPVVPLRDGLVRTLEWYRSRT
ncbi:MAG TPA: UDP-glucuronic acid decarboxylase family protein [Acidimicrobiia bacterium]|jgi:dTDP-glucose 4,6-dehydratase